MKELETFAERVYISGWTYPIQWEPSEHQVDTSTVGQYTGLTDKNGRKIFEGDIVVGNLGTFAVGWSKETSCFVTGENRRSRPCMNFGTMQYYEVVGNIHDNPELLEESEA